MYGTLLSPVIPAFFADCLLSRRGNVVAKASVSQVTTASPTLNDLYFLPGGNPGLNSEKGRRLRSRTVVRRGKEGAYTLSGVGVVVRPAHRRLDSVGCRRQSGFFAGEHQRSTPTAGDLG